MSQLEDYTYAAFESHFNGLKHEVDEAIFAFENNSQLDDVVGHLDTAKLTIDNLLSLYNSGFEPQKPLPTLNIPIAGSFEEDLEHVRCAVRNICGD